MDRIKRLQIIARLLGHVGLGIIIGATAPNKLSGILVGASYCAIGFTIIKLTRFVKIG